MKRKVLLTENDVLEHSYGMKFAEIPAASPTLPSPQPPVVPPPLVVPVMPPPPPFPPPAIDVPVISIDGETEIESDAVALFIEQYTKSELIKLAQDSGLDVTGNKAQLARRLVEAGAIPGK